MLNRKFKLSNSAARLALVGMFGAVLSGCSLTSMNERAEEALVMQNEALSHLERGQNRAGLRESRSVMRQMDEIWVDTTPMALNSKSLGAPKTALDCDVTFNPKAPITTSEFARIVGSLCSVSINITSDAAMYLSGEYLDIKEDNSSSSGGGASEPLPSPNLSGGGAFSFFGGSVGGSNRYVIDTIQNIDWINKPLKGLLDVVTSRLGLGWKYEDDVIQLYYVDTQIFNLFAMPSKTTLSTTVKSGAESSSSGENTSAFSSDGSSQETGVTFESDIVKDIEKTLESMITPKVGKLSVSSSTGTVTVTDRPDVLRLVKKYLDSENKRITRQVMLKVQVLSVQTNNVDSAGINWDVVYSKLDGLNAGISTGFSGASGGFSANAGIVKESDGFGARLIVEALSTQGRVSTQTSPTITTLNLKPAPILVGTQTSYLKEVSTTGGGGSDLSQQSLVPGTVTTGFNMTLLPYIMEGNELLLQYSINLSELIAMKKAKSGDQEIEMPDVDNRIFNQSVKLRSGETLVLSGFDQEQSVSSKEGTADPGFWLLGGRGEGKKKRDTTVILITPVIVD